jgi:hypothetical protein
LNGEAFKDLADWVDQYRTIWEQRFDRLDEYLKTVTAGKQSKGKRYARKK